MPTKSPPVNDKLHIIFWGFGITDQETVNRLFRERMLTGLQKLWKKIEEHDIKVDFPAQAHRHHFGSSALIVYINLPPHLASERTVKEEAHFAKIAAVVGKVLQSYFSLRHIECNVTVKNSPHWRSKA